MQSLQDSVKTKLSHCSFFADFAAVCTICTYADNCDQLVTLVFIFCDIFYENSQTVEPLSDVH